MNIGKLFLFLLILNKNILKPITNLMKTQNCCKLNITRKVYFSTPLFGYLSFQQSRLKYFFPNFCRILAVAEPRFFSCSLTKQSVEASRLIFTLRRRQRKKISLGLDCRKASNDRTFQNLKILYLLVGDRLNFRI